MNTEDEWFEWWQSEGRHMERLPHHDAMDHLASMTRIAWLNGAFKAADEIDRLTRERDEARREVCRLVVLTSSSGPRDRERMRDDLRCAAEQRGWDCFKEQP